jgi:hypothetical protein
VRRALGVAAAAVIGVLAAAPIASAHSFVKGAQTVSHVTGGSALRDGVSAKVIHKDDELRLTNESGRTVIVLGYAGEPYLRFDPGGISVNVRSPSLPLSAVRFPALSRWRAALALHGKGAPKPSWIRVAAGSTYTWFDQRIHEVSRAKPAIVKEDPSQGHLLKSWVVPLTVGGAPATIDGILKYEPARIDWVAVFVPFVPVFVLFGAALGWLILPTRLALALPGRTSSASTSPAPPAAPAPGPGPAP